MRTTHGFDVEKAGKTWWVTVYAQTGRAITVTIRLEKFKTRLQAIACRDALYQALGSPF